MASGRKKTGCEIRVRSHSSSSGSASQKLPEIVLVLRRVFLPPFTTFFTWFQYWPISPRYLPVLAGYIYRRCFSRKGESLCHSHAWHTWRRPTPVSSPDH